MIYVSCANSDMYRNGAWYDSPILLNEMVNGEASAHAPEFVSEIFPPFQYNRPFPFLVGGGDIERQHVADTARSTVASFPAGPATVLSRIVNCSVSRSVIYLLRNEKTFILYESHRPSDRGVSLVRNESEVRLVDDYKRHDPFIAYLWIGSAGSMNYGHWLVDDLPRTAAITVLRRVRPYAKIVVVTPECGPQLDAIHAQTIGAIAAMLDIENIELITVNRDAKIFFEELYYVTPPTHHPVLKSPEGMAFVAEQLDAAAAPLRAYDTPTPKRLFVTREWTGARDLANQDEIQSLLSSHGFVSVDAGNMPALKQAQLFADADFVIGCMGAAMTNTIFCHPGAKTGCISPHGWIETFYWDLAAARGQHYAACYGPSIPQEAPAWRKNFRVNPAEVMRMLDALEIGRETGGPFDENSSRDLRTAFDPFRS